MGRIQCPWCGRVMEPGELESQRAIVWYPSEPRRTSLRDLLSWEGFRELCSPLVGNIRIPQRGRWERTENRLPASHCPDCDRFVIIGRLAQE